MKTKTKTRRTSRRPASRPRRTQARGTAHATQGTLSKLAEKASFALNKIAKKL